MRMMLTLLGAVLFPLLVSGSPARKIKKKNVAERAVWQEIGCTPFLDGEVHGKSDSAASPFPTLLTTGMESPNVWIEGSLVDSVETEEGALELKSPFAPESYYAPIVFEEKTAEREGWYRYRILEPYRNGWHTDSLYVRFERDTSSDKDDGDRTGEDGALFGGELEPARIVNLIAIDAFGFTRFKILNIHLYDRVELQLFNRLGRLIFQSRDYKNDFDFSSWPDDTYYYKVTLCSGALRLMQNGFVEVTRKQQKF